METESSGRGKSDSDDNIEDEREELFELDTFDTEYMEAERSSTGGPNLNDLFYYRQNKQLKEDV